MIHLWKWFCGLQCEGGNWLSWEVPRHCVMGPFSTTWRCCSCCFCASRFVLWKSIPLPDQLVFHPAAFQCPQVTHEPLKIPWLISCHLTCREGTLWHRPPGVTRALSVSTRLLPSVRWMLWTLRGGAPRAARASGLLFSCSKACW